MSTVSYKDAGVDIDAGNQFVENIKPIVKSTFDSNVVGGIGSFAGAYEMPTGYKKPVMLGATDGVGTKLKLAIESGKYDTVGIDLVAMCVNDLICNFGTPLFFSITMLLQNLTLLILLLLYKVLPRGVLSLSVR